MTAKGSEFRANGHVTLRAICASRGKSVPMEGGHPHPLDKARARGTWEHVGYLAGKKTVFTPRDAGIKRSDESSAPDFSRARFRAGLRGEQREADIGAAGQRL